MKSLGAFVWSLWRAYLIMAVVAVILNHGESVFSVLRTFVFASIYCTVFTRMRSVRSGFESFDEYIAELRKHYDYERETYFRLRARYALYFAERRRWNGIVVAVAGFGTIIQSPRAFLLYPTAWAAMAACSLVALALFHVSWLHMQTARGYEKDADEEADRNQRVKSLGFGR